MDPLKKISFSRYKVLKRCGYMFYLDYVLRKEKAPGHPATLYGLTVHRVFEEWFDAKCPGGLEWILKEVPNLYEEQKIETGIPLSDIEHSELCYEAGMGAENLYRILGEVNQLDPSTQAEVGVSLHSKGYLFNGRVDFMKMWDRNTVQITDAKGNKNLDYLDKNQIVLYAYVIHKLFGVTNFRDCGYLCFHPGVNQFVPVEIDLTEAEHLFNNMVQEYDETLKNENYVPDPAYLNCFLCSVYDHCHHRTFIKKRENLTEEDTKLNSKVDESGNIRTSI
jgi:CRISPR/Cas system-associated exonuclease Cas4 (RecB family)